MAVNDLGWGPFEFGMTIDTSSIFSGQGLPTPTDTPKKIPSRAMSRQSQTGSSSPAPFLPPLSFENDQRKGEQGGDNNEDISPLDPRRFTPNLHASLVSQILLLQREVENKNNTVNNLEEFLHTTKEENERLSDSLASERMESRSIRRQMQKLENTTLTALEDIAKERDEALESLTESRRRLETFKGKVRSQDEETQRANKSWDREKQDWDTERRNLEARIHMAEGRLKSVLAEIAAAQADEHMYPRINIPDDQGMRQTWYTKESDCTSTRSNSVKDPSRFSGQSLKSHGSPSFRASMFNGLSAVGMGNLNGMSLAEELEFDQQEKDAEEDGSVPDVLSPDALPEEVQFHRREASIQSFSQDQKAWKLLGLFNEDREQNSKETVVPEKVPALSLDNDTLPEKSMDEKDTSNISRVNKPSRYADSGTQYSAPSSPRMELQQTAVGPEKVIETVGPVEPTANQRRKRVSAALVEQTSPTKSIPVAASAMVSSACQTVERPPSPPLTPVIKLEPPVTGAIPEVKSTEMVSSSTQTNGEQKVALVTAGGRQVSLSMAIPAIEIHPPGSRPPSSHTGVVLPPRTRNAGCQANIERPITTREVSVQTEKIEVDRRPIDIPLRASSATGNQTSLPRSGLASIDEVRQGPRRSSRRNVHRPPSLRPLVKPSSSKHGDVLLSGNDSGPLHQEKTTLRRPIRKDSLFAGFDSNCNVDTFDLKSPDLSSDDDFKTAAPIRKTLSKVQNSWKLVPHSDGNASRLGSAGTSTDHLDETFDPWLESLVPDTDIDLKHQGKENVRPEPKLPGPSTSAHQFPKFPTASRVGKEVLRHPRTRSPSAPELPRKVTQSTAPPPFPVPTRFSSRRIPTSASEGAYSPTPKTTTFFSNRTAGVNKESTKNPLRKVRSAAAVTRFTRNNGQPRTPQPISPTTGPTESPPLPRMPRNSITSRQDSHTHIQPTTHALPEASLEGDAAVETPGQQTSVVDAIAQTMVGEWMWKYVRRRKSFGVTDDVDFDEKGIGNGVRHKRWVWLAPYERAVMWSSKQPTSGPALLGKNGRKLNIQSVLDVKDDTPLPKNAEPKSCFGRSILILTPQRALKFTATSRERHYVWLTALSFLSHSPLGMEDLATIPPLPQQEDHRPPSQPTSGGLRRAPIRDSIRIAKSKPRPGMNGHAYTSPITTLHDSTFDTPRLPILPDDPDSDAAEPPGIPRTTSQTRTHNHARKRSNTGPRPAPPNSFHSFPTHPGLSTRSLKSSAGAATRDVHDVAFPPRGPSGSTSADGVVKHHSQFSHDPMPVIRNNFFDAVGSGTVRMEAFIEAEEREVGMDRMPKKRMGKVGSKKKDLRYWGIGGDHGSLESVGVGAVRAGRGKGGGGEDPFRGF